jgi:uncharacterized protein YegL
MKNTQSLNPSCEAENRDSAPRNETQNQKQKQKTENARNHILAWCSSAPETLENHESNKRDNAERQTEKIYDACMNRAANF